ncbi:hypothetical protein QBC39DRAFT_333982 [Podospora conica]|nr:hypothetical protein QBC39DRAFT_333982 [Schizothecium conicum]
MVKPDYDRDYYADLGLPVGANISDIKKQYRSLVLKYHPDRNPGQEEQAKERFVIIQAANEILSNPENKSKYDANRRRPAPATTASGTRGNPYSNVSRDMSDMFGAPPKRATRPQPTPYSTWGVPPAAKPKTTGGNPMDHLRAWDRMRPSKAPTAAASGSSGPSTSSTKPAPKPAAQQPPPPPPRTAYQARQQEASFGIPRRTGFAPASPMGDEPQVKSNNYNNSYNSYTSNLFSETAANLRKAAHAQSSRPASAQADGPSDDYDGVYVDTRQRTPYASNVGEKTNPFEGASTTRAKEGWRKTQDEEPEPSPSRPARRRSSSVGDRDGFPKPAAKAPQNTAPNGFPKPSTTRFASQASERYSPRPPANAKPPQRPPKVPDRESQPAPAFQKATANSSAPASKPIVYDTPFNTLPRSSFPRPHIPSRFHHFSGGGCNDGLSASPGHGVKLAEESSSVGEAKGTSTRVSSPPVAALSGVAVPDHRVRSLEELFNNQFDVLLGEARGSRATRQQSRMQRYHSHTNATLPISFTVPDDDDETPEPQTPKANPASQQARFMRNSTESINTRFVADDKPSKYEFNAGGPSPVPDPLRPDPFLRAKQRSRSTPRPRATSIPDGPGTPPVPPANPPQPEVPKPSAFDAGLWQEKIGPHNFVPTPVTRQASSPTRPTRVAKKPKSKIPPGAVVIDIESSSDDDAPQPIPTPAHARTTMHNAPSPNAMDIDPPSFGDAATPTGGVRTIHVEPSKPEWRPGHVSGVSPDISTAGPSAPPPKPPKVAEPEEPAIFKEMLNVEPFAAPKPAGVGGAGLGGFGDMKLNLPFPSQAAATNPIEKEKEQQQAKEDPVSTHFHDPPACPHVPAALTLTHPTPDMAQVWADYATRFHHYLREWTAYEQRIVEHFWARKRVREEAGDGAHAWVHVRGDAAGRRYRKELEQDRLVRRKWDVLAEAHESRVKEFSLVHRRVEGLLPVPA